LGAGPRSSNAIAETVSATVGIEGLGAVVGGLVRLAAGPLPRKQVLEELQQSVAASKQFNGDDEQKLNRFFTDLFALPVVDGLVSYSLTEEYERLYTGSAVLTDARPVVVSGETSKISSFFFMHQLKIRYENINGPGELYVAMTTNEMKILIEQLQTAIQQEGTVRTALAGSLGSELKPGED
jgi:hypothetical protein